MNNGTKTIDRNYIILRISNWKERLDRLFSNINDWSKDVEKNIAIEEYEIPQAREELMSKFDIEPTTIHSLVLSDDKNRVSFIPLGLWVIGSNGRINISTKTNQYILVDLGDNETSTQWMLVNPAKRKEQVSFDKMALEKIIKDEKVFE